MADLIDNAPQRTHVEHIGDTTHVYGHTNEAESKRQADRAAAVADALSAQLASVEIASTSHTATLANAGNYLRFTSDDPVDFTIPPDSSVDWPDGSVIEIEQAGEGPVTFVEGSGVTLNSRGDVLTTAGQFAVAFVKRTGADTWTVGGDL